MYRKFLIRSSVMAAAGLLCVACFNMLADPYRAYRVIDCQSLDLCKSQAGSRIAKAELLAHSQKFDAIIFGSSRAEIALDPKISEWGDKKAVNVSLRAPSLYEIQQAVDFAMLHQRPKLAVICVDFFMSNNARSGVEDFAKSKFNPGLNRLTYHLDNLLSLAASKYSYEDVRRWLKKDTGKYDLNGFFEGKEYDKKDSQRRAFLVTLKSLPESGIFYNPDSVNVVGDIADRCLAAGSDVVLVILPIHAVSLERIHHCRRWEAFEQWKRDMATMVAGRRSPKVTLWDFTAYRGLPTEPIPPTFAPNGNEMKYYFEASHFSRELGRIVIGRINGCLPDGDDPAGRFGVCLTPENIESHLDEVRRDRELYVASHPSEIELVRQADAAN